jgi:hypothetical protein
MTSQTIVTTDSYAEDARANGFYTIESYAQARLTLKRQLRTRGVRFNPQAPLAELEALARPARRAVQ